MAEKKKTGAVGKYTPERVDLICHMIASTGQDQAGYKAAGITKDTFYTWVKEKPDFSDRVSAARAAWRKIDEPAMIEAFRQGLIKAMLGYQQERTNAEETTLSSGEKVKKVSKSTATVPPAEWAFRIVAPTMAGKFGLERTESTTKIDFGSLSKEQLARIVAGERPEDVV